MFPEGVFKKSVIFSSPNLLSFTLDECFFFLKGGISGLQTYSLSVHAFVAL